MYLVGASVTTRATTMDEGVYFRDNLVYFDDFHHASRGAWGLICRERKTSSFVNKLAYALVGYYILSECMKGDERTGKKRSQVIELQRMTSQKSL